MWETRDREKQTTFDETRHVYYTDSWQAIEERLGTETDPDRQYLWGLRYIDDLILRDRDTNANGTLDERLYALQDGNWNVIALTDENGNVQERYAYIAYGVPTFLSSSFAALSSSNYGWETLYCGYRWDEGTELYAVRNRYLQPLLGVWIRRDPLRTTINLQQYVSACPVVALDPMGLVKEIPLEKWEKYISGKLEGNAQEYINQVLSHSPRGCIGYVCQELGVPFPPRDQMSPDLQFQKGPPNFSANLCFKTLAQARARQNRTICKGTSCNGTPAKARVVELRFASEQDDGAKWTPEPTILGGAEYNLQENSGLPPGTLPFWLIAAVGGSGVMNRNHQFANFDVGIEMTHDVWVNSAGANHPPRYSTTLEMDQQYNDAFTKGDRSKMSDDYWWNERFWCVVCETEWRDGKPQTPDLTPPKLAPPKRSWPGGGRFDNVFIP